MTSCIASEWMCLPILRASQIYVASPAHVNYFAMLVAGVPSKDTQVHLLSALMLLKWFILLYFS